jgi:hypothetical protein
MPSRSAPLIRSAPIAALLAIACTGSIDAVDDIEAPRHPAERAPGGSTGSGGSKDTPGQGTPPGMAGGTPAPSLPPAVSATESTFTCDAQREVPVDQPLLRLTTAQYRNTVRELIARVLPDDAAAVKAVNASVASLLDRMPEDQRVVTAEDHSGTYRRLDQDIEQPHVDAAFEVARALGAELTRTGVLGKAVGACAVDTDTQNDDACLTDFIQRFGLLALRRPPTAAEVAHYKAIAAGTGAAAYADVIGALLMAPQFVFRMESGAAPISGQPETFALTAYELASRLSYQFWDTMPDAALFEAARSGALETPAGLGAQVDRMLADPRARPVLRGFFQDWLKLDALPQLEDRNQEPIFKAFAGPNLPTPALRGQMIDEVLTLSEQVALDREAREGSLARLLLDERVFVRGPELAAIYGVRPWDGKAVPALFPAGERVGLLSRAAFHAFGSANTRPVMKGVFVRQAILCDELPPPPDDAAAAGEPELSTTLSTREVVEAITEAPGSACAACHSTMLNGIGFATEDIDALGRLRREQTLFDEAGKVLGRAPVDTRARPQIVFGDTSEVSGAAALARKIVDSGKAEACAARQYFRFTFARWERLPADGCVLEALRRKAVGAQPLAGMLREVALLPAFGRRFIPGGAR